MSAFGARRLLQQAYKPAADYLGSKGGKNPTDNVPSLPVQCGGVTFAPSKAKQYTRSADDCLALPLTRRMLVGLRLISVIYAIEGIAMRSLDLSLLSLPNHEWPLCARSRRSAADNGFEEEMSIVSVASSWPINQHIGQPHIRLHWFCCCRRTIDARDYCRLPDCARC